MTGPSFGELEDIAVAVSGAAADLVRHSVGLARVAGDSKSSPTDVVTETDLAAERFIRAALLDAAPGSAIVGEEFDDEAGSSNIGWIVDPIDGTVNFLYDLPVVSVSIAATVGGQIVAGAVADVIRDEVFSAARGEGARRNGEHVTVNQPRDLSVALVGTGFSYTADRRKVQGRVISRLLAEARDIRCMGSSALNLCWVGCGRLDAFYQDEMKIYDYAAGGLIAEEAGASVEWPSDNALDLMIASAPNLADGLRAIVAPDRRHGSG